MGVLSRVIFLNPKIFCIVLTDKDVFLVFLKHINSIKSDSFFIIRIIVCKFQYKHK